MNEDVKIKNGCGDWLNADFFLPKLPCFRESCLVDWECQKEAREKHLKEISPTLKQRRVIYHPMRLGCGNRCGMNEDIEYHGGNYFVVHPVNDTLEVPPCLSLNQFLEIHGENNEAN